MGYSDIEKPSAQNLVDATDVDLETSWVTRVSTAELVAGRGCWSPLQSPKHFRL